MWSMWRAMGYEEDYIPEDFHSDEEGANRLDEALERLTGDLDGRYAPYIATPADILKLAHHGAAADTPEDFLAAVNPGLLLVSTGDRNRLAAVEERFGDIPACATASHGALTLTFTGGGYTLTTFK